MSGTKKRIAAIAGGLALLAGGITAATTIAPEPARAAGCYAGAQSFVKKSDRTEIPTGDGWWKTTSRCNDINVRLTSWSGTGGSRTVKVCFQRTGCQSGWTTVNLGDGWKVVASNVKDGTRYRLRFGDSQQITGYRAN